MARLANRVAIVTGAAQGIGAAISTAFAQEGAIIAAVDLNKDGLADFLEGLPGKGHAAYPFDISNTSEIAGLVDRVEAEIGPIGILVNCAGICPTRPLLDADEAIWRKVFDINVHGPFFMLQAVAKRMLPRKYGSIINMASISSFLPKAEQADYGASKAAIVSITRSAALVLGPHGIRVNAIAPGLVNTPMTRSNAEARAKIRGCEPMDTLQPMIDTTALKRIGQPEEMAAMALFLASDEAGYVTGQTIDVCGGILMR